MAQVFPFRGIRYRPELVELASVLAPPFDVIDAELQGELYGRAMQNVVRVELGRDYPGDVPGARDRYTRARDYLRVWTEQGVVAQDREPGVYLHRHTFEGPWGSGERIGCFVALRPEPHGAGAVLRHELTLTGPRRDRLSLLRATGTQTSPIFLLHRGGGEVWAALRAASGSAPTAEAELEEGGERERHRLWRITDPDLVAAVREGLGRGQLFIADGHHRYETALELRLSRVLALVSALDDPGNLILPTHRVVPRARLTPEQLVGALRGRGWEVEGVAELPPLLARMAELRPARHAFGIVGSGSPQLVSRIREGDPGPGPLPGLDVSVLESVILEPLLGVAAEEASGGRLAYTRDPQRALELALESSGVGILLNPPTAEEVARVALAGAAMPQKSTYFHPKVPAGLVMMRVLDQPGADAEGRQVVQ